MVVLEKKELWSSANHITLLFLAAILYFESAPILDEIPPKEHSSTVCIWPRGFDKKTLKLWQGHSQCEENRPHGLLTRWTKIVSACPIEAFHCYFWISIFKKKTIIFTGLCGHIFRIRSKSKFSIQFLNIWQSSLVKVQEYIQL